MTVAAAVIVGLLFVAALVGAAIPIAADVMESRMHRARWGRSGRP